MPLLGTLAQHLMSARYLENVCSLYQASSARSVVPLLSVCFDFIINVLSATSVSMWNQGWSVVAPILWLIGLLVALWLWMLPFQDYPEPRWKRRNPATLCQASIQGLSLMGSWEYSVNSPRSSEGRVGDEIVPLRCSVGSRLVDDALEQRDHNLRPRTTESLG